MENDRQLNELLLHNLVASVQEMPQKLTDIKTKLDAMPSTHDLDIVKASIGTMAMTMSDLHGLYHSPDSQRVMLNITKGDAIDVKCEIKNINSKLNAIDTSQNSNNRFYTSMWFKVLTQLIITVGTVIGVMYVASQQNKASERDNMRAVIMECVEKAVNNQKNENYKTIKQ